MPEASHNTSDKPMKLKDKKPFCTADNGLALQRRPPLCLQTKIITVVATPMLIRRKLASPMIRIKAMIIGPKRGSPHLPISSSHTEGGLQN
jgi:hypothetical protein